MTLSPMRMSFCSTMAALCSVARDTVVPHNCTGGSKMATGVSTPSLPTSIWIARIFVIGLLGLELVRHRPARLLVGRAEPALLVEVVDLDDHAVRLVGQIEALVRPAVAVGDDLLHRVERADLGVHREAILPQQIERFQVRLDGDALDVPRRNRRTAASVRLATRRESSCLREPEVRLRGLA